MSQPETVASDFVFPECPRWRDGGLWFADCHDGKVIRLDPSGKVLDSFDLPGKPAGIGFLPDGQMLIVSIGELRIYRRDASGALHVHADLSKVHRHHTNDMVIDEAGNAYVGEIGFHMESEQPRPTAIALVRPDGKVEETGRPILTPNGSVITPDGRTFIVAESLGRRLTAYDVAEDGTLSNQRLFAQLDEMEIPDGICLDAEGCIWSTAPFTSSILRVSPTEGVVERIGFDDTRPYACMLGGEDRRDLYICCAPDHDPAKTVPARAGMIKRLRVAVPAAGLP
jgi:sugar lactone lactonase YvrE